MFGRLRRAVADEDPAAYAVLHAYNPEAVAGALAAGMGAAGVASAGASAVTSDGQLVSAPARAVTSAVEWGRRQQRRFVRLPGRVLVIVTDTDVCLHEWTLAQGKGRRLVTWPRASFTAERVSSIAEIGVRIVVDGKIAILSGPRGLRHRDVRTTVDAILGLAAT